jgi:PAS domain-containing protein
MRDKSLAVVLGLYDSVVDQSKLPEALQRFADFIGARGCIVFEVPDRAAGTRLAVSVCSADSRPELIHDYIVKFGQQEFADQAPFVDCSLATDRIELFSESIIGKTKAQLRAQPNVRWMRAVGVRHRAGCLLDKDNRYVSRFSVQFSDEADLSSPDRRAALEDLLPHVAKAIDFGRPSAALAAMNAGLIAALDHLRIGVCLLDRQLRIVTANREFDRQAEAHRAFRIDPGRRLSMPDPTGHERFVELVNDALSHGRYGARPRKEAFALKSSSGREVLCVEIAPLAHVEAIGSKNFDGAIVYSHDTSLPIQCDTAVIRQAFGFTKAEGELIARLSPAAAALVLLLARNV